MPRKTEEPMTAKQLSLLRVAKGKLGLSEAAYRDVLRCHGQVASAKELTQDGFRAVMEHFRRCGFQSTANARNYGDDRAPHMPSAAQVATIRRLWGEWTDGEGDDSSLGTWLQKSFRVSHVRFLDHRAASKAITALKAMARRRAAAGEAGAETSTLTGG